jgi:hypothetical protein
MPAIMIKAGVVVAAAALVAVFDPSTTWFFPACPFHAITGWLCPLCGSSRAIHALLRGAPVAAFAFNPLLIVGLGAWAIARDRATALCFSARGAAILIVFGVVRNIH